MARRHLQRSYVQHLSKLLTPTPDDLKSSVVQRSYNSDAPLYVALQLKKVEEFCRQQLTVQGTTELNRLHYEDMLRELKLINDKRNGVKRE